MFGLLSWIPVLGPIWDGLTSTVGKLLDNKAVQIKADAQVVTAETQASAAIIEATHDDIGIRLARDIILVPWSLWAGIYGWDTLVALHWPNLMWHVADPPKSVEYLPYAVIVFLLGNIGINTWKRK